MAKQISATPTLQEKEVKRFLKSMLAVDRGKLTKAQKATAKRIKKNQPELKRIIEMLEGKKFTVEQMLSCMMCGQPFVKLNEHTYRADCEHIPSNWRVSVG